MQNETVMKKTIDPYRLLFPLGTLFALTGTAIWLRPDATTILTHPRMMIGGFLFSYIAGFLMTAVPKMTGSRPAGPIEIGIAGTLAATAGLLPWTAVPAWGEAALALGFSWLGLFCARRVLDKRKPVPEFFVLVGGGLSAALVGSWILFLVSAGLLPPVQILLGRALLFQITVLSLVLGIGCRLVPLLAGRSPDEAGTAKSGRKILLAAVAGGLWASALLEARGQREIALFLRAALSSAIGVTIWRPWSKPRTASRLGWLITASAVMVLTGLWAAAFQPALAVHWMHLTYVGGFGLMTFTVASRVSLAHGGFDLTFEHRSRVLPWFAAALLIAAVTRVAAPFVPQGYLSHLRYAAALWIVGVLLWAWVFVRKMIRPHDPERSHC